MCRKLPEAVSNVTDIENDVPIGGSRIVTEAVTIRDTISRPVAVILEAAFQSV
jgi:hypothetical protein